MIPINLNTCTLKALSSVGLEEGLAGAIVTCREEEAFNSWSEVKKRVEGFTSKEEKLLKNARLFIGVHNVNSCRVEDLEKALKGLISDKGLKALLSQLREQQEVYLAQHGALRPHNGQDKATGRGQDDLTEFCDLATKVGLSEDELAVLADKQYYVGPIIGKDLNTASLDTLISVDALGKKVAQNIVAERESERGLFSSWEDFCQRVEDKRIPYLGEEKLRTLLLHGFVVRESACKLRIDLNRCSEGTLSKLLTSVGGLTEKMAAQVVGARQQKPQGAFKNWEDLQMTVKGMGLAKVDKLRLAGFVLPESQTQAVGEGPLVGGSGKKPAKLLGARHEQIQNSSGVESDHQQRCPDAAAPGATSSKSSGKTTKVREANCSSPLSVDLDPLKPATPGRTRNEDECTSSGGPRRRGRPRRLESNSSPSSGMKGKHQSGSRPPAATGDGLSSEGQTVGVGDTQALPHNKSTSQEGIAPVTPGKVPHPVKDSQTKRSELPPCEPPRTPQSKPAHDIHTEVCMPSPPQAPITPEVKAGPKPSGGEAGEKPMDSTSLEVRLMLESGEETEVESNGTGKESLGGAKGERRGNGSGQGAQGRWWQGLPDDAPFPPEFQDPRDPARRTKKITNYLFDVIGPVKGQNGPTMYEYRGQVMDSKAASTRRLMWEERYPATPRANKEGNGRETVRKRVESTRDPELRRSAWADLLLLEGTERIKEELGSPWCKKYRSDPYGNVVALEAAGEAVCAFELDHIFPWSRGGLSVSANFMAIYWGANRFVKNDKIPNALTEDEIERMNCGLSVDSFIALVQQRKNIPRHRVRMFDARVDELLMRPYAIGWNLRNVVAPDNVYVALNTAHVTTMSDLFGMAPKTEFSFDEEDGHAAA